MDERRSKALLIQSNCCFDLDLSDLSFLLLSLEPEELFGVIFAEVPTFTPFLMILLRRFLTPGKETMTKCLSHRYLLGFCCCEGTP